MPEITGGIKFYEIVEPPTLSLRFQTFDSSGTMLSARTPDRVNALESNNKFLPTVSDFDDNTNRFRIRANFAGPSTEGVEFDTILIQNMLTSSFFFSTQNAGSGFGVGEVTTYNGRTLAIPTFANLESERNLLLTFDRTNVWRIWFDLWKPVPTSFVGKPYIGNIIFLKELATLKGYPTVTVNFNKNQVRRRSLMQKSIFVTNRESIKINLALRNYTIQDDISLLDELAGFSNPFYIYLCGGRRGEKYFKANQKGYGEADLYKVAMSGNVNSKFSRQSYLNGIDKRVTLEEII